MLNATTRATMSPTKKAIPPTSGVGTGCARRSSGSAIQFLRRATRSMIGVATAVAAAALAPTIR